MKKHYTLSVLYLCITLFTKAQEAQLHPALIDTLTNNEVAKWQFSTEQTITNSYVWKGIPFYSGLVVRPSVIAQSGNLKIHSWSHMPFVLSHQTRYNPDINLFVSYEKSVHDKLTLSPQLTSFFFPSNHKNIFTVLLSTSLQYDLDPVGILINPMVDLCGNAGAVHIEYGFYKKSRINHNLNIDSRLLMGWGNASFTDYFLPIPPRSEFITNPKTTPAQSLRNARLEIFAEYICSDRLLIKPQFIVYSNFIRSYTNQNRGVSANGGLTLAYSFRK